MIHHIPHESWLQKGTRFAEQGLKVYGTARGLWEAGSAIAGGIRNAYQIASPMLAMI